MSFVGVEGARGRVGKTRFWGVKVLVGMVLAAFEVKGKVELMSARPSRPSEGLGSTAALKSSRRTLKPLLSRLDVEEASFWRS